MSDCKEKKECICCGSTNLKPTLDLGTSPLANSYHKEGEILPTYPLGLNLCTNCYHLQLTHIVNPDLLFKDYLYVSGTSQTMRDYFKWFARFAQELYDDYNGLLQASSVLDIGCNDGTLLDEFKFLDFGTVGVDPAKNLYPETSKRHKIVCDYFRDGLFESTNDFDYRVDIITAQNVFAHTENPLEFLTACEKLMYDESLLLIQTSQADLVLENQFDSCYHEHISFFNINSMNELVKRSGLYLNDVIKTSIHGLSYLFVLGKQPKGSHRIKMLIEVEKLKGLMSEHTYKTYKSNVRKITNEIWSTVDRFRDVGYTIIGYGAAAKGMTVLNASDTRLDYVIDDNPLKQGLYTPVGSSLIVPVDFLKTVPDDKRIMFVPLAWNYFDEIKSRIKQVRDNENDVYLKYFPSVKVSK